MKSFKKFIESYQPVNEAEYNKEWWDSKSDSFKKRYIEKHPNSIYAQNSGSSYQNQQKSEGGVFGKNKPDSKPRKQYFVGQTVNPDDDSIPDGVLIDDDGVVIGFTKDGAKYQKEPTEKDKQKDKENLNQIDKFSDLDDYLMKNRSKMSSNDFEKMIKQYDNNPKLKDLAQRHYIRSGKATPQAIKQYYKPKFDKVEAALSEKNPRFSVVDNITFDELLKAKNAPKDLVDKAFDLVGKIANQKKFKDSFLGKTYLDAYKVQDYISDKRFDKKKALDILQNPVDEVYKDGRPNGTYTTSYIWPAMFNPGVSEKDVLDTIQKLPTTSGWQGDDGNGYAKAYKNKAKELGKPVNPNILKTLEKLGPKYDENYWEKVRGTK